MRKEDWIKAIIGKDQLVKISEMKPEKTPKKQSKLDELYWIENANNKYILNIEPQGYYETSLPARMLRYRSDIWEYTMSTAMGTPSVKQVVIFFYEHHENKENKLQDNRSDNSKINYSYDILRIWQKKKDYIINNKLIGLYPILPLMK